MNNQSGFTTVELMVTLFIAALFLLSGFQLYGVVMDRSSESRKMSVASNIGYEVLRKEGSDYTLVTNTCSSPQVSTINRSVPSLTNVAITLERCRPIAGSTIIKVTSRVKYDTPQKEVVHATYVNK